MSKTIIRRTNPDLESGPGGTTYRCSVCATRYNRRDDAVACAERDFDGRDREARNARRRARYAQRRAS